jgi:4-hydroxy-2-oxoheptanedioate aldolase
MALAGFDFAIIDQEHACLDYQTVENMVRAAEVAGITPLVRVGQCNENAILRVMESGAHGVIVPHVMDGKAARFAVEAVKYYPRGFRGISALTRAARWTTVPLGEHMALSNEHSVVIPMVEDVEGIENIEGILSVDGVDAVFIGPADLARAYGVPSEKDSPVVKDAIEKAAAAAVRIGKARLGVPLFHPAFSRGYQQLFDMGIRFMPYSTDAVELVTSWQVNLQRVRQS